MQTKTKKTIAAITGEQEVVSITDKGEVLADGGQADRAVDDASVEEPTLREQVAEGSILTWKEREERDRTTHDANCRVCRMAIDPGDSDLYAVKNKRTREFVHVIADSTEDAIAQSGWSERDVQYTMGIVLQHSRKKMSVETKAELKQRNKQKRVDKATARARLKREVVDTVSDPCYSGGETTEPKRKEVGEMTLNEWVKEFMDGFIMLKDNGKRTMDPKALFGLAEVNKLDIKKYKSKYKAADAGRIRMTIGNMLKGAANRRHKLMTPGGKSTVVPSKLVKGQPTEDAHGERLKKSA